MCRYLPKAHCCPPHSSSSYRLEHRPHAVRFPLRYERAMPLFTGNCDPTYVLYTTVVLIDLPLFTGRVEILPYAYWFKKRGYSYLDCLSQSSYSFTTTHFDLSSMPNIKVGIITDSEL